MKNEVKAPRGLKEDDFKENQVNSPGHYKSGDIECIDAIESSMTPEEFRGYLKGNVIRYVWRYSNKGGAIDLAKCENYLDRLRISVRKDEWTVDNYG